MNTQPTAEAEPAKFPNTKTLPIAIMHSVSGHYSSQRSNWIHPNTGKIWNPAMVGALFRIGAASVNPVGGVYVAKYAGENIYFRAPLGSGRAIAVDVGSLPDGVFYVPAEHMGDNPCGWLPGAGKTEDVTTIDERFYRELVA